MARLNLNLARLDSTRKWVILSSGVVALSTLMPWYLDRDAFGVGARYLGLNGPLFLVGWTLLLTALGVGLWNLMPAMGRSVPRLPLNEGTLFTAIGLQNLFLLLIANSVFFHPKFGVNITLKETQFGMLVAFGGVLLMIWSGYQKMRQESKPSIRIEEEAPLIRMPRDHSAPVRRDASLSEEEKPKVQPLRMDL